MTRAVRSASIVEQRHGRKRAGSMAFTKMHGLRNDFIVIDAVADAALGERTDWRELVPGMCDRRSGVGADGVLVVSRRRDGGRNDFVMRVINADGSEPEMCGNGLRCVARLLVERGYAGNGPLYIETAGAVRTASAERDGDAWRVMVDMGTPALGMEAVAAVASELTKHGEHQFELKLVVNRVPVVLVSTGNPHAVTVVPCGRSLEATDHVLEIMGKAVEHHAAFPRGVNFQFVHVRSRIDIDVRTWERGCGITAACGSGACAAAVASALLGHTDRDVTVHMRGGDLRVQWRESDDHMHMTGPADVVFEGAWPIK